MFFTGMPVRITGIMVPSPAFQFTVMVVLIYIVGCHRLICLHMFLQLAHDLDLHVTAAFCGIKTKGSKCSAVLLLLLL